MFSPPDFLGFRSSRSCLDNVSVLVTDINVTYVKKEYLVAAFIDIEGAYDNVVPSILIRDLLDSGIPYKFVMLIKEIIWKRKLTCRFNGRNLGTRFAGKGLPQGFIISSILFNLYMRQIMFHVQDKTRLLAYADDVAMYSSSSDLQKAILEVEESLYKLDKWISSRGLKISETKTQLCIFTKKRLNRAFTRIRLNGVNIENSTSVRFLEIYLDGRLNWKEHIRVTKNKAERAVSILKAIAGFKCGVHPTNLLVVFKGLVRAILNWGSFFYDDAVRSSLES